MQNLGYTRTNYAVFLVVGVKMSKKWTFALALFICSKTQKTTLGIVQWGQIFRKKTDSLTQIALGNEKNYCDNFNG